ncbi:MAG: hypothetical protein IRZ15_16225 [Bryobacteraceae bacterium]|nr:hypothetical protein [Bryobacteraceae bacterium]
MLRGVLAQQILSVVVAVGSPHHTVDVMMWRGLAGLTRDARQWAVNCDQDDRTEAVSRTAPPLVLT